MALRFATFAWVMFWGPLVAATAASGLDPVGVFYLAASLGTTLWLGWAWGRKTRRETLMMTHVYLVSYHDEENLRRQTAEYLVNEMTQGDPPRAFSSLVQAQGDAESRAIREDEAFAERFAEGVNYWDRYHDDYWEMEAGATTYCVVRVLLDPL